MIAILLGLLALAAFVVLVRLLWLHPRRPGKGALIGTLAALALVAALAVLAATGRLHWLAAVAAAVLPFLRKAFMLLFRVAPLLGRLFTAFRQRPGSGGASGAGAGAAAGGAMTRQQALQILGLAAGAGRQEILDAHRRLMAKNHPDKGGSTFIAQQLNEAKRVLLG